MRNKLLLTLLVLLLLIPFTAFAQQELPPTGKVSNTATLTMNRVTPVNGVTPNQVLVPNPYGCVGSTQNPHNSTHVPGTINVTARTQCAIPVPTIYVETILQRESCFIICWWSNVGTLGTSIQAPGAYVQANSATTCTPGKYRGVSYHYIIGADGIRYEAGTVSSAVNLTC